MTNLKIEYWCEDGSRTVTRTASLALLHWYGRNYGFSIRTASIPPLPSPYSNTFLSLLVERIETLSGKLPLDLKFVPDVANLSSQIGGIDWIEEVEERFDGGDVEVIKYENYCLALLKWLVVHGDIVELLLDGKRLRNLKARYRSIDDTWELS
jgi:hypothetical protein